MFEIPVSTGAVARKVLRQLHLHQFSGRGLQGSYCSMRQVSMHVEALHGEFAIKYRRQSTWVVEFNV